MIDPLYSLSGFAVGLLVGMTGVGGGALMTPILIMLFGVHPATAVGTDLLYAAATKTGGSPYLASDTRALARRFESILEDLEKSRLTDRGVLYAELFPMFLLPAFALVLLELVLRLTRFRRLP